MPAAATRAEAPGLAAPRLAPSTLAAEGQAVLARNGLPPIAAR